MQTVAQPLQRDQRDRADQASLPDLPDVGAQLLEVAARYAGQVLELPDDVATLRRMVTEQAFSLAKLLMLVDRLSERVDRLEARR